MGDWKKSSTRKPLILRGARQVGKTTLIKRFARSYKYHIILDLEKKNHREFFNRSPDSKTLIESLLLSRNISAEALSNTLLFIDEIQELPKAIQFLRFFYEDHPYLHVIAAGSLLEFAMRDIKSFPVGRIEYLYLHPLNFGEYLGAIQHDMAITQLDNVPVREYAHSILLELFNQYALIGGMPEIIKIFLNKKSLSGLPRVYGSIWGTYQDDIRKYASNKTESRVIKHIISSAPVYLDKRIKFQNFGNSNYRSREVGDAFRTLDEAKIIQMIYPSTDLEIPVRPDLRKSPRMQFLDTGLINHALGIQAGMIGMVDLSTAYKGCIIPHIITQELISINTLQYKKPNFWIREKKQSTAEVDLILDHEGIVFPVEIKSGSAGSLKSLHQFVDRSSHPYAVRMWAGEYSIQEARTPAGTPYYLMNLPYYLGTKIYKYLDHFMQNYSF